MIALGRAGVQAIGSILRQVWPHLISWGVNKLITSNFGQAYVAPGFHDPLRRISGKIAGTQIYP